ncbi:MAG: glycosyltransferase [Actinobacteria bacterium]|nr:glycosyltransferase [Actinomycetota bacterium]
MAHRILYLLDGLGMGGAERGLVLNLRHLDRTRVEPEVAYLWGRAPLRPDVEALGVPVHRIGGRSGLTALATIPRIARLLRSGRFQAIHTALVWASIVGRIAGWRAGVRVISHIANVDPLGHQDRELSPAVARRVRLVGRLDGWTGRRYVDRFVAITEAVRDRPIRGSSWDRSKIDVVRRGIDLDELRERAAAPLDPPIEDRGDPSIVSVGRLSEQKGHRYLIRAMGRVLEEHPRARLLVAGEGHLRAQLEDLARPFGDRIALLGPRRDVPALLAGASAFAFPSLWEGQGNALLEAMGLGLPIVTTAIPSSLETVTEEESALLVPPADADALAGALLQVLSDPPLARSLGEGAARAAARYDIRDTTRDLEAVYDSVLGHTARAGGP